ncbi:MAG: geranylgeranyl reductase family protein [Candidatus Wukongarchaeota archaeon]|nr:NAD(P)/FAD-dependent oxidoreductase [Candidatus Wukongarchaeota archaeon]
MDFPTKVDIVVVGGGPAGSTAAAVAAKAGANVLIVDRKNHVGVPVQCGEAIGKSKSELEKLEIPKNSIVNTISGFRVYSPSNIPVTWYRDETQGYIVDRRVFDKELFAKAVELGANTWLGMSVTDIIWENGFPKGVLGRFRGEKIEIRANIIIGADGVNSVIARETGLRSYIRRKDLDTSVGYDMVNVELDEPRWMDFFTGLKVAPRGYVWVFPQGETRANIGIGVGVGFGEKTVYQYLNDFMEKHPIGTKICKNAKPIEFRVGAIPVGGPPKKTVTNGVILVGDAAGQVHPLTGGGISYSMTAATVAGEVAQKCLVKGDVSEEALADYEKGWREKLEEKFALGLRMRKLLEVMTDEQLDKLAQHLSGDNIIELVSGKLKKIWKYIKFRLKEPEIAKLLKQAIKGEGKFIEEEEEEEEQET